MKPLGCADANKSHLEGLGLVICDWLEPPLHPLGAPAKFGLFFSPQPKFGVPRVEIGPIESTLQVIDFCVLFRHYYKQDAKYFLMNFVFGQSKGILWGKVSKVIKLFF